jgi:hypothetical protein
MTNICPHKDSRTPAEKEKQQNHNDAASPDGRDSHEKTTDQPGSDSTPEWCNPIREPITER